MSIPSNMNGKVAVITGAAAGLGRATALLLARLGADVALVDINAAGLQNTAAEVRNLGRNVSVIATDLMKRENCFAAVERSVQYFGRLDALCNVAGYMLPAHTPEMAEDTYERTIGVNLSAPFFLSQKAIPHLLETNGSLVNVTSCAAFRGQAYFAAYCATKAGLTHMTKALALEYMNKPIRINAVAPGGMMTELAANMLKLEDGDPSLLQRFHPLRGLVEIDDVAQTVAFLASDAARGYHGACINIDRGITAD